MPRYSECKNKHTFYQLQVIILLMICFSLSALSGGCAWLRNDTDPVAEIDAKNIRLAPDLQLGPNGWKDAWPDSEWWKAYNDPQLDELLSRTLKNSPTLAVVNKRSELALAQAQMVRAEHGPALGFRANIDRQHVSDSGFLGLFATEDPLLGTTGPWYTTGNGGLVGKWDIDIWGKHKAQVEAALGAHAARMAEGAQAELVLSTTIVKLYYEMQTLFAMRDIVNETIAIESFNIDGHEAKVARGLETQTSVEKAKADKYKLEQELAGVDASILILREALRAMTGELLTPASQNGTSFVESIKAAPLPQSIGKMPENMSYVLLARRPDLQAARHYIEASLSSVDAARAEFYPTFNLTAFFGFDTIHIEDLFKTGSQQFNLIGGLTLPIFDSGRLNANLKIVRTESDLSIHSYNAAVVNAVREVSEAAIEVKKASTQLELQEKSAESHENIWKSADSHYQRGLIDKMTREQARLPVLADKGKLLEFKNKQIQADIKLIKALGGGYQPPVREEK